MASGTSSFAPWRPKPRRGERVGIPMGSSNGRDGNHREKSSNLMAIHRKCENLMADGLP